MLLVERGYFMFSSTLKKAKEPMLLVLSMSGCVAAIFGASVFASMYYFNEKLAWIICGICFFVSSFGLNVDLEGRGVRKVVDWLIKTKTSLLGISILLLAYLYFYLGVLPHQVLWMAYVVLSLITAWFVEDLSYDIAGRGIFMASSVIVATVFINFRFFHIG